MIGPLEVHRASRRWDCGWLVAWTRLRYRREFWQGHVVPGRDAASGSHEARGAVESAGAEDATEIDRSTRRGV